MDEGATTDAQATTETRRTTRETVLQRGQRMLAELENLPAARQAEITRGMPLAVALTQTLAAAYVYNTGPDGRAALDALQTQLDRTAEQVKASPRGKKATEAA